MSGSSSRPISRQMTLLEKPGSSVFVTGWKLGFWVSGQMGVRLCHALVNHPPQHDLGSPAFRQSVGISKQLPHLQTRLM